jgi:nucleotide-binding universal stress UspA family protein
MRDDMLPVVVGVDGSRPAQAALEFAAEEAAVRVTSLIAIHAISADGPGDDVVAEAVAAARAAHPSLEVTGYSRAGDPVRVLSDMASGTGLLVVGHRGRSGRSGREAGSVAARLVGAGPAPLMVHRPLEPPGELAEHRGVLVGIDPAHGADTLAEFAFAEAARRGAPLEVIWLRPTGNGDATATDVDLTTTTRYGVDIAIAMAAASHSAQMVIVGTTGGPAGQWAARALVDRAGCPVAIVPL